MGSAANRVFKVIGLDGIIREIVYIKNMAIKMKPEATDIQILGREGGATKGNEDEVGSELQGNQENLESLMPDESIVSKVRRGQ